MVALYLEDNYFTADDILDLRENGLMIAFAVFDYYDKTPYDDGSMVGWQVKIDEYKNQERVDTRYIKTHPCTDQDMSNFYKFSAADEAYLT